MASCGAAKSSVCESTLCVTPKIPPHARPSPRTHLGSARDPCLKVRHSRLGFLVLDCVDCGLRTVRCEKKSDLTRRSRTPAHIQPRQRACPFSRAMEGVSLEPPYFSRNTGFDDDDEAAGPKALASSAPLLTVRAQIFSALQPRSTLNLQHPSRSGLRAPKRNLKAASTLQAH